MDNSKKAQSDAIMKHFKRKETDVQSAIISYLKYFGYVYRIQSTGLYDPKKDIFRKNLNPGIPDLYFMSKKHGEHWFEVKRPGGKLRYEQKLFKAACFESNVNHHVVDSVDQVMEIIK